MQMALLLLLMRLTPWHGDTETASERRVRMDVVVQAATSAAENTDWPGEKDELVTALIALARAESEFAMHIHAGKCRPDECDGGKAASLWQIHDGPWLPEGIWNQMQGTDLESTTLAATWAAHFLAKGRNQCGNLRGAYSLYATGKTCHWAPGIKRARYAKHILSRLLAFVE